MLTTNFNACSLSSILSFSFEWNQWIFLHQFGKNRSSQFVRRLSVYPNTLRLGGSIQREEEKEDFANKLTSSLSLLSMIKWWIDRSSALEFCFRATICTSLSLSLVLLFFALANRADRSWTVRLTFTHRRSQQKSFRRRKPAEQKISFFGN